MSKAFTRESEAPSDEDDDGPGLPPLPAGTRNYMTPAGYRRLRLELMTLLDVERPKVVETVSWAAKNGDRSENGDYLYGKKRLREIDRRIRFLTKRLDVAEVAPGRRGELDRAHRAGTAEGARGRRGEPDDPGRPGSAGGAQRALSGAGDRPRARPRRTDQGLRRQTFSTDLLRRKVRSTSARCWRSRTLTSRRSSAVSWAGS